MTPEEMVDAIKKRKPVVHAAKIIGGYGFGPERIDRREVRILAIAEGHAMIRRKGAVPYICPVGELELPEMPATG
jgi:hypothetical protein